jgi:hypothetical protein
MVQYNTGWRLELLPRSWWWGFLYTAAVLLCLTSQTTVSMHQSQGQVWLDLSPRPLEFLITMRYSIFKLYSHFEYNLIEDIKLTFYVFLFIYKYCHPWYYMIQYFIKIEKSLQIFLFFMSFHFVWAFLSCEFCDLWVLISKTIFFFTVYN